jgi:hypothetical protein
MPYLAFAIAGQRLLARFESLTVATWHLAALYDYYEAEEVIVFEGRNGQIHVLESVGEALTHFNDVVLAQIKAGLN